jgi:GDP-mannose 6-dehydrogenase
MSISVSVFGLGYVGCVSAACFADLGHDVVGVDVSDAKVDLIRRGQSTIIEEGIEQLVARGVGAGRLRATHDVESAVHATDVSLICVGTPSRPNGSLDLSYVERVCEEIGAAMRTKPTRHTVIVRSTVLPGTIDTLVIPTLQRTSGKQAIADFGVGMNPEFLREGSSIKDFCAPPFTVIGTEDPRTVALVRQLYCGVRAPFHAVSLRVAEMLKYSCNCYHGLKVAFANEIGNLCKSMDIDSHEVMRLFIQDTKLNVSAAYLRPGFAFGGSCLPKDLRAITYRARQADVETPVLSATLASNRLQVERAFNLVMSTRKRRVGVLGLAFKEGTDDLRESPMVTLGEMLIGKGIELRVYDTQVEHARVVGANKEYVEREIPHIWELTSTSLDAILAWADVIIVGTASPEFTRARESFRAGQIVVDLVRAIPTSVSDAFTYHGICW